jgi:hypothetical protein
MAAMVATAFWGKLPLAVSPLSITASVPSNTALATSVISARVGSGLFTMLSSICRWQGRHSSGEQKVGKSKKSNKLPTHHICASIIPQAGPGMRQL